MSKTTIKDLEQKASSDQVISSAISFNQNAAIVVLIMIALNIAQMFGLYLAYAGSLIGFLGIYYAIRAHIASHKAAVSIIGPLCIYAFNAVGMISVTLSLFRIYLPNSLLILLLLLNYALTIAAIVFCFRTASRLRKSFPEVIATQPSSILKKLSRSKDKK